MINNEERKNINIRARRGRKKEMDRCEWERVRVAVNESIYPLVDREREVAACSPQHKHIFRFSCGKCRLALYSGGEIFLLRIESNLTGENSRARAS